MSEKRAQANRQNALKSTGPKSAEGKARCSLNSLKHGLRSASLAVPALEDPEDWAAHRNRLVRDLSPVGYLEVLLCERAAALLWRLGRAVRYESEVVSAAMMKAEEDTSSFSSDDALVTLRERMKETEEEGKRIAAVYRLKPGARVSAEDASFILDTASEQMGVDLTEDKVWEAFKLPEGFPEDTQWEEFDGWTRGMVEEGLLSIKALAAECYQNEYYPWTFLLAHAKVEADRARGAHEKRAAEVDRVRRTHLLPHGDALDRVSRYETTLERSFFRTIHELQRLQAARSGVALPPPAALDLEVNVHQEAP